MNWIKWIGLILIGLVLVLILLTHIVQSKFMGNSRNLQESFEKSGYHYSENIESINGHETRWITTGNDSSDLLLLFFHGAPGSWKDFESYLLDPVLQEKSLMIAIDRPGYGLSGYGTAEPSIIEQQEIANQITRRYQQDSILVVGYSYGGPVAGSYAARNPERIKSVLLLAPVIAPDGEKIFWFNHILKLGLVKLLLPGYINVANDEKLTHAHALNEIKNDWKIIDAPITHLHCIDDWIAPYETNTEWIKSQVNSDQLDMINWEGDSHFLPNSIKPRILPILLRLIGA